MISHYLLETQQRATMFTFNCLIVAQYSRTLFCKNSVCTAFFVTSGFACLADCSRLSRVLECSHKHTATTWLTEYNISVTMQIQFSHKTNILQHMCNTRCHKWHYKMASFDTSVLHKLSYTDTFDTNWSMCINQSVTYLNALTKQIIFLVTYRTRSQAVARIADRTTKNCRGHVT